MTTSWRPTVDDVKCVHIERTSEGFRVTPEALFRRHCVHITDDIDNILEGSTHRVVVEITHKTDSRTFEARVVATCDQDTDSIEEEVEKRRNAYDPDRERKAEIRVKVSRGYTS